MRSISISHPFLIKWKLELSSKVVRFSLEMIIVIMKDSTKSCNFGMIFSLFMKFISTIHINGLTHQRHSYYSTSIISESVIFKVTPSGIKITRSVFLSIRPYYFFYLIFISPKHVFLSLCPYNFMLYLSLYYVPLKLVRPYYSYFIFIFLLLSLPNLSKGATL